MNRSKTAGIAMIVFIVYVGSFLLIFYGLRYPFFGFMEWLEGNGRLGEIAYQAIIYLYCPLMYLDNELFNGAWLINNLSYSG